jgi:uncharacterized membrane protein HdeD (DUF308 family)
MMSILLAKNWWSLVIRGLTAILLGLATVLWPAISLAALVQIFFTYTLFDGLIGIAGAVRAAEAQERWWRALLIEGLTGVATAIITMAWTAITALTLVYVIAAGRLSPVFSRLPQPFNSDSISPADGCSFSAASRPSF